MKWVKGWPLLMTSAGLVLGAAVWSFSEEFDLLGASLLAAGLVTLGAWIAEEVDDDRD